MMERIYGNDEARYLLVEGVVAALGDFHLDRGKRSLADGFHEPGYYELVQHTLPPEAMPLAEELIRRVRLSEWANPFWLDTCDSDWKDVVQLSGLFKSESLHTQHGTFFDQRFVHYLLANFEDIGKIHWRQFEGLAAEYLHAAGMRVEIGPGRNDGGVDLRAWNPSQTWDSPPSSLIQCKRHKTAIEKVVIKALFADVQDEGAASGLLVTTFRLSPGAAQVRAVRAHPITAVDRQGLRRWLEALRVPGSGISLGE